MTTTNDCSSAMVFPARTHMSRLAFGLRRLTTFGRLFLGLTAAVLGLFVVSTRRRVVLAAHGRITVGHRDVPMVRMTIRNATIVRSAAVHRTTVSAVIAVLATQIRVGCRVVVVMAVLVERSTAQRRSTAGHRRRAVTHSSGRCVNGGGLMLDMRHIRSWLGLRK